MKRKVYNHGFYDYYYKCQECGCESISLKDLGGFQHADLICDNCGTKVINNKIQIEKNQKKLKNMTMFKCDNCQVTVEQTNPLEFPYCPKCGEWIYMYRVGEEKSNIEESVYKQIIDTIGGEEAFCKLCGIEERPQVDFKMLNLSIIAISGNLALSEKAKLNLKLFFELLSKSSTFAHKAHKELNKLM